MNELDVRSNFSALNESIMNDSEMAALLDKARPEIYHLMGRKW
mgnify:CR=1 FL=1|jgi:predicted DNA-binding transcriptional regulator AlpA|tara:strand:- start:1321 stop:1449 length:129 start_codon:yes stop_codon:yes gene_type:complete